MRTFLTFMVFALLWMLMWILSLMLVVIDDPNACSTECLGNMTVMGFLAAAFVAMLMAILIRVYPK